ncbi:MAG: YutD-like domain-containing protein [bacterium]
MNLLGVKYSVIKDEFDCLKNAELDEYVTDFFTEFDYIVGDYAYDKLRLKGFYDDSNKKKKKYNNIKHVDDYIKNKCAYGCKYFVIKKID